MSKTAKQLILPRTRRKGQKLPPSPREVAIKAWRAHLRAQKKRPRLMPPMRAAIAELDLQLPPITGATPPPFEYQGDLKVLVALLGHAVAGRPQYLIESRNLPAADIRIALGDSLRVEIYEAALAVLDATGRVSRYLVKQELRRRRVVMMDGGSCLEGLEVLSNDWESRGVFETFDLANCIDYVIHKPRRVA